MPVDPDAAPPAWFWTHDGVPASFHRDTWPGQHLIRLTSYGTGPGRRLATLTHQQTSQREARLGLDAAGLAACVGPVAITFDDGGSTPRLSVVLDPSAGPATRVHTGLTGDQVAAPLESKRAYPTDLDAISTPRGVRFTVVMRRKDAGHPPGRGIQGPARLYNGRNRIPGATTPGCWMPDQCGRRHGAPPGATSRSLL